MSITLRGLRPRVRGRPRARRPVRPAASWPAPGLPADARRGQALPRARPAAARARRRRRRRRRRRLTLGTFLALGGYSRYFVRALHDPGRVRGLVLRHPAPRWRTRRATCSRSWTTTGCSRSPARRSGARSPAARAPTSSGRPRTSPRCRPRRRIRSRHPARRRRRDPRRRRPAARGRRRRRRHPPRPGAAAARRPDRRRARGARRVRATPATRPCCTPTPRCCPPHAGARASWNYRMDTCAGPTTSRSRSATNEPAAAPRRAARLPGHPQRRPTAIDPARCCAGWSTSTPSTRRRRWPPSGGCRRSTTGRTAFAGAYHGWGFHEDGCAAGRAGRRGVRGAAGDGRARPGRSSARPPPVATPALYDVRDRAHPHARRCATRFELPAATCGWSTSTTSPPAGSSRAGRCRAGCVRRRASRPPTTSATRPRRSRTTSSRSLGEHGIDDVDRVLMLAWRAGCWRASYVFNPLSRLLVLPRRRVAGLPRRRGAQHLRRAARLPAAARRRRPGGGGQGVLRLAVPRGRRPLPDAVLRARARGCGSPWRSGRTARRRSPPASAAPPARPRARTVLRRRRSGSR